ncbi:MAG: MotA/TolQ/ExbB proton channel family protein [Nitrospirae bacterium]|nr:MotA/TolQ/ExbB proton channel family protein [Nitrospirota bacterium]
MKITQMFLAFSLVGGIWILYLLIGLSVLSVAIILERLLYFRANRPKPGDFQPKLLSYLQTGKIEDAIGLAQKAAGPEARCARLALYSRHEGTDVIRQNLLNGLLTEQHRMEKRLLILGTLGNNAPFIGLLGTVLGIIKAFYDLSIAGAGGPSVVMLGIAEALVATAMGLFIAIPAVIAYNYFQRRTRQTRQQLERLAETLLLYLKSEPTSGSSGAGAKTR